jgi:hypothetical protein
MLLLALHLWASRAHARSLARRWQPQVVDGRLVSVYGVDAYVRACAALAHPRASALVQASDDGLALFVLQRVPDRVRVVACLWPTPAYTADARVRVFEDAHQWYRDAFDEPLWITGEALQS